MTSAHSQAIKQLIHDIISLWGGYGEIRIEIRAGAITRIGMNVWSWNRKDQDKGS